MNSNPYLFRLAVIGTGAWAQHIHYPAITYLQQHPPAGVELRLRGVCSLDPDTAQRIADQYGFERVYADLDALVADPEVDAVAVIVGPGPLPQVLDRLAPKGVPILTEKPPGPNSHVTEQLARTITVPHVVAFNRRFAPMNVRFKACVAAMTEPFFVEARFCRHGRLQSDFVRETGIHLLNFLMDCLGPIARARTSRLPHPTAATFNWVVDVAFASGLPGRLQIFPSSGRHTEEIDVHGLSETVSLRAAEPRVPRGHVKVTRVPAVPPPGSNVKIRPNVTEWFTDEPGTSHLLSCGFVAEYEELIAIARGVRESRSTLATSIETMRLAEAIEAGRDYVREPISE